MSATAAVQYVRVGSSTEFSSRLEWDRSARAPEASAYADGTRRRRRRHQDGRRGRRGRARGPGAAAAGRIRSSGAERPGRRVAADHARGAAARARGRRAGDGPDRAHRRRRTTDGWTATTTRAPRRASMPQRAVCRHQRRSGDRDRRDDVRASIRGRRTAVRRGPWPRGCRRASPPGAGRARRRCRRRPRPAPWTRACTRDERRDDASGVQARPARRRARGRGRRTAGATKREDAVGDRAVRRPHGRSPQRGSTDSSDSRGTGAGPVPDRRDARGHQPRS